MFINKNYSINNSEMEIEETSNKNKSLEEKENEAQNIYSNEYDRDQTYSQNNPENNLEKSITMHPVDQNCENFESESFKENNISKCYTINNGNNSSLNNSRNNNAYALNKKRNKVSNALAFFLNLKKFFFLFVLLFGYVTNYSAFNLVYFAIAIFFAFNYSDNEAADITKKKYLLYINLFFCVCFIIFKSVIFFFFSEPQSITEISKNLLITLGCVFLYEKNFAWIMLTFALDTIIFIFSIIYIFTCSKFNENLDAKEIKKSRIKLSESKVSFLYLILHFIYYCILIINISFSTILYSVFIHIGLLLKIFNLSGKYNSLAFKLLNVLNILRLLGAEILNIYILKIQLNKTNLKLIFNLIGIFINQPELSKKPLDPDKDPQQEEKYWEDLKNLTKFVFDFFFTALAIVLYALITSIRVLKADEKKRSFLKKQLLKENSYYNNFNNNKDGHYHSQNEASSVAFTNKKFSNGSKANTFTFLDKMQQEANRFNFPERKRLKPYSKSSDEEILHTIHEDEASKSNFDNYGESESLPVKNTYLPDDALAMQQADPEKHRFSLKDRLGFALNNKNEEEEEFDINKISFKNKVLLLPQQQQQQQLAEAQAELKSPNANENNQNQSKNHIKNKEKNSESIENLEKSSPNSGCNAEKLIDENDPLTKQIAFDQPGETEDYQIFENKDLISIGDEGNEAENSVEDIDENLPSEADNDYSSSDFSRESATEEKDKKINKCWAIVQRFLHGIYKFYKKIKSFLYAYLISAYFRLDVCRICVIIWISQYSNYQTIPLILWFFFSIQAESLAKINVVTFLFAWPSLLINYYCFMVSNIDDLLEFSGKTEEDVFKNICGLENFGFPIMHFAFVHFTIIAFTFLSVNLNASCKNKDYNTHENNNNNYNNYTYDTLNHTYNESNRTFKNEKDAAGAVNKENENLELNSFYVQSKINKKEAEEGTVKPNEKTGFRNKKDSKTKNAFGDDEDKTFIEMEEKSDDNINMKKLEKYEKTFGLLSKEKIIDVNKSLEGLDRSNYKESLLNKHGEERFNDYGIYMRNKSHEFESNPKKAFLEGKNDYELADDKHPIKIKVENSNNSYKNKPNKNKEYMNLEEDGELENQVNNNNPNHDDTSSPNNNDTMVRFSDIVIKFFIKHIDKITLIFIYLIAIEKVNIIHFLLTMIFMLQLILPQVIRKICTLIIYILQLIILFEYIWFFIKVNYTKIDPDWISLFLDYDTSKINSKTIEINIVLVIYCYYIQKENYKTSFYNDQKLDFEVYILKKFEQVKLLNFLQEIYVWILFVLIFITITCWYYQTLFAIKLFFFSILFYKFLNLKNLNSIKKYIWLLILYCGLNTMLIYFYQFRVLNKLKPIFEEYIDTLFPDIISKNIEVIGLAVYTEKELPKQLLPHYLSNFLSILILWEISRICELIDSQQVHKISIPSNSNILNTKYTENVLLSINDLKEEVEGKEKKNNENNNNNESNNHVQRMRSLRVIKVNEKNVIIQKNELNKISNKPLEDKKEKYKSVQYYNFILSCLKFAFFLCRIYWLIIYAIVCVIFSAVSFSFSIIVYIFLITISFLSFFKKIVQRTDKSITLVKDKMSILKFIRYPIEKRSTNKWINVYRKSSFKLILFFALTFIFLTYFYTLIEIVQRDGNEYKILSKYDAIILKALSYIIGIYNKADSNKNFISSVWAHLSLLILICLDAYIQKLEILISAEIENMKVFITKLTARNSKLNKFDKLLKSFNNNTEDKTANYNRSSHLNLNLSRRDSKASENLISNYKSNKELYKQMIEVSMNDLYKNSLVGEDVKKSEFLKRFMRIFLKIDVRNRIARMDNTSEFTELNQVSQLFPKNLYVSFFTFLTKFFEELIIFLLILSALFKLNVISIFYILLVFFLQISGKNYRKVYCVSLIISSLIVLQALLFLSNLSQESDPNSGESIVAEILSVIKQYLNIPWIEKTKEKVPWEFFLSLGVNNYQVLILWLEFVIVIFIFIYFDNFCYSIFQENDNPYAFINFYYYSKHEKLKQSVNFFSEKKFENLRKDLKSNFFLELPDYNFFLAKINKDYDKEIIESQEALQQIISEEIKESPKENNITNNNPSNVFNSVNANQHSFKKASVPLSVERTREKKLTGAFSSKGGSNNFLLKKSNSKIFDNLSLKNYMDNNNINYNKQNFNLQKVKKGKCYKICEKMRKFMYLNMHNFTLILTLFLSLLNTNAISTIYIGFVIYNLNKSYSIKRKKNFTFPSFIKTKFRLILLLDLLIQMLNQIPFDFYTKNLNIILFNIGIYKIKTADYEKDKSQVNDATIGLVLIKAFTYFLLSVQVKIYCSNDFKDFYLKYIFKNNNIFFKKAIKNSFLYNNRLIDKMKKSIKSRESVDEFLIKLENKISEWSSSNIIKKNSHLRLNGPLGLESEQQSDKAHEFYFNAVNEAVEQEKSLVSFEKENYSGPALLINDSEKEKEMRENKKEAEVKAKALLMQEKAHKADRLSSNFKSLNKLKINSNATNNSLDFNAYMKTPENFDDNFAKNNNKQANEEHQTSLKERLEAQFTQYFEEQSKTKLYFKEKIHSLFLIEFINVFNQNTSNFIFIHKEDSFEFEKCILKGDSYYKSTLEAKIDEEIDKINFSDISTHEIDVILKNMDKARKVLKKKLSGKKKKSQNKKKSKRKSNLSNKDNVNNINIKNADANVIQELNESEEKSDNLEDEIYNVFKDDQKIEDVALNKYHRILTNKIFEKYYKRKEILFYIFYHFSEFLLDNFQFICFFIMILNNLMNGNIISLVWPLIVFTIGIISNPRPSNVFWKCSMVYVSAIIMLKFILQIQIDEIYPRALKEYLTEDFFRIGLRVFGEGRVWGFINYIIWDCLLLLCLLIQQYILITNGLWKHVENEIETIKDAHERIFRMQNVKSEVQYREFADKLFETHLNKMKIEDIKAKEKDNNNINDNSDGFNGKGAAASSSSKIIKNKKNFMKLKEDEKDKAKIRHKATIYSSHNVPNVRSILTTSLARSNNLQKVKSDGNIRVSGELNNNNNNSKVNKNANLIGNENENVNYNNNNNKANKNSTRKLGSVYIDDSSKNKFSGVKSNSLKEKDELEGFEKAAETKTNKLSKDGYSHKKDLSASENIHKRNISFMNKSSMLDQRIQQMNNKLKENNKSEADKGKENPEDEKPGILKRFYESTFPRIRNNKPGKDFYAYYCGFSIVIIFYIIIFFYRMDRDIVFANGSDNTYNQFTGGQVFFLFLHAILCVIDRIIYARQSCDKIEREYFYYSKETLESIPREKAQRMQESEYYSFFYQKELPNYPLLSKFSLHVFITIFSHLFIFFYLPIIGNLNLNSVVYCPIGSTAPCNDISHNPYLIIFYFLYIFYLFFSALQVRFGLHDIKKKSLFMRKDTLFYSVLFKCYKYCPFIYELKLVIDWTCTPTALDIFKWFKFESVYDNLFMIQCLVRSNEGVPVGKKIRNFDKLIWGVSTFILLISLLLGPILLFSTLNPTNMLNDVYGASVSLILCFQSGETSYNNFTLFKSDSIDVIKTMDDKSWEEFGYSVSPVTKAFPQNQVQLIQLMDASDNSWNIATPHIEFIIDRLGNYQKYNRTIILTIEYNFFRKLPNEAVRTNDRIQYTLFEKGNPKHNGTLIEKLYSDIKDCSGNEIIFDDQFIPSVRLSSSQLVEKLEDPQNFKNITLKMNYNCTKRNDNIDYLNSFFQLRADYNDSISDSSGIFFHTFSYKISSSTGNYNVLTFYSTFIILIGNYIRMFFTSGAERIITTDMPEPGNLLTLCEGIKISRYRYEFEREEYLYCILIDLMRSPETLKILTKSCVGTFKEKLKQEKMLAIKKN